MDSTSDLENDIPIFNLIDIWSICPSDLKITNLKDLLESIQIESDTTNPDLTRIEIEQIIDEMELESSIICDKHTITKKAKSFRFMRSEPADYLSAKQKVWVKDGIDLYADLKIISENINNHRMWSLLLDANNVILPIMYKVHKCLEYEFIDSDHFKMQIY